MIVFRSSRRSLLQHGLAGIAALFTGRVRAQETSTVPAPPGTDYAAIVARMMAALPFERVTVPGQLALAEYDRLQTASRGLPVVVGGDEDLERLAEQFSIGDTAVFGSAVAGLEARQPDEILALADTIAFPDGSRDWVDALRHAAAVSAKEDWPAGLAPDAPGLTVATDVLSGRPLEQVHILLIPAEHSWQIPAYLRWGGWNACPAPEYHVAALRRWHDLYGAEVVGMSGDVINLRVRRPPQDRAAAIALACEQYAYCPDFVDQGTGTITALGAGLINSDWWFFWWD